MNILEVENLSLRYGSQQVLNHISFSIEKGKIIGFLGPNGAGKSSILRILSGLVFPETGNIKIKNESQKSFCKLRSYCGYLIDSPSFYPYLSAKQNLRLIKKMNKSNANLDELLIKVGLADTHSKKVEFFSMGMKQRLAIAQALLHSPEMLILDEPFNGLDPNGFQDLINLLKELNEKGITIIVSSHLLNELEQLADHFILLHEGNIELDISKTELLKSKNKIAFTFKSELNEETFEYLQRLKVDSVGKNKFIVRLNSDEVEKVVKKLVEINSIPIAVQTLTVLQEKYLEITD